ncbi:MAG: choice-of-anchor B family protein [Phaeodactylibacter sp.]|nr:choice-of-anchor B family protein [Phaeodactylibacter sp.]
MNKAILFLFSCLPVFLHAQDSLNMSLLGGWDDPSLPSAGSIKYNDIWGYADCEGNEYAIMGSARYIHFINITGPEGPVEIARFEGSVNSVWRDFKTYGRYAYAVADQGTDGLMVFDLSQLPGSVSLVFQDNENFTRSHNVFIDVPAARLYLAGSNAIFNGVAAYSLAEDPGQPAFLGTQTLPGGYFHDIYVRNHIAFCSHGGNGLWAYDFSDFDNIQVLGNLTSYPEQGYNHASWLSEDGAQLVFADETHGTSLKLVDVSDLSNIRLLDLFRSELLAPEVTNSIAHNPFVREQYAIVSYYHDGVQIFDLSNPEAVERIAYYDTYPENQNYSGYQGCWGVYPFLPSGNIIASDISHGLFVLSADSISFRAPEPFDAAIELVSGSLSACEGDTISLAAGAPGLLSYEWLLDGEHLASGAGLPAVAPGAYQLVASNGICTKISEALELEFFSLPEAELPESPFIYCGEAPPAISTPSQGDNYNWFLNGEALEGPHSETLEISEGGFYQVEVFSNGCSRLSEELEVILGEMPSPVLNIILPESFCAGSDTVAIDAGGSGNQYYIVSDGNGAILDSFIHTYTISASGFYQIEAYTEYCSLRLEPLEVTFNAPVVPTLTVEGNTLSSSPASAYQWYKDGAPISGATGQSYTAEESGLYSVETTDANGCMAQSETILLEITTGISILAEKGVKAYPNPVEGQLFLEAPAPPRAYRLLSASGEMITSWRPLDSKPYIIEMGTLPSGIYLVQLLFEEEVGSLRVARR